MGSLRITEIKINGMRHPYGLDEEHPVVHYVVESEACGTAILAYRMMVEQGKRVAWDTGRCSYTGSNDVVYAGEKLQPKTEYRVTLSVWDEKGVCCEETAVFETGFLGTEWEADWLEPEQEPAVKERELSFMEMIIPSPEFWGGESRLRECKQLRREFMVKEKPKKVRIYATAHGVYNLYLNGRKISDRRLAPETSAYKKLLYYQTYDVTDAVCEGANVIGVLLADGWWIGRLGMAGDSCNYGDKLGFLMQLELEYEDGTRKMILSDERFTAKDSYIRYADLSIGEKQDFTQKDDAWMYAGSPKEGWKPCRKAAYDKAGLCGQPMEPVVVTEELAPAEIFMTPKGELVIDFGQVLAGVCRFELEAAEGEVVSFEHGEVLDLEGNFLNNILGRNKDQKDVLVCRQGIQVFEPQFTYHGFRYVRVTGIQREQLKQATACVLGSRLEKTGDFCCSDPRLNQLQHNIEWSTKSNMFSVPTDCPQREKLGWTGDIQIYAKTGCFNYNLYNFLRVWLKNVRAEQGSDGEIPVVVPNHPRQERTQRVMSGGSNSSAAWGDACVLVPYYLYCCYGDIGVLKENFEMMTGWLSYIKESCAQKPEGYRHFSPEQKERNPYLWTKQYHFGDWLIPSLRALPDGVQKGTEETAAVIGSCFYAITVSCFIEVCRALGETALAEEYRKLLEHIRNAVREEFVSPDGVVNHSELQGLYVIVLKAGVVEGEQKKKVLEHLTELIRGNGYCLDTGFVSVPYLLDVLYENGYQEMAYRLLFQTKGPSWLYMVENGATSIWENWLAVLPNGTPTESSYNHYAFGCVGDFIYRRIGGITAEKAGYQSIRLQPDFACGLTESDCGLMTPYGRVRLHWKRLSAEQETGQYLLEGCVPVGTEAALVLGGTKTVLGSGTFCYRYDPKTETLCVCGEADMQQNR